MRSLCFASNNPNKITEVKAIIGSAFDILSLQQIGCGEELPETHPTIEGNAAEKASYVWNHYHVPCFADDSGLEVEALHGSPGVDSAHFAGPQRSHADNITLLLKKLEGVTNRAALFKTVISLFTADGSWLFEGTLRGTVRHASAGSGGFGYDPVFQPDGFTRTLAELTMDEKNAISHRAVAVRKLAAFLQNIKEG